MTNEYEDPVVASRQFDKKEDDFAWGGRKNKRMVQWFLGVTVVMFVLMGFVIAQAFYAANTAREAKASELSTYQSCLNKNAQDVEQIGLWHYVIELTGDKALGTLQHYVNSIFAQRECVDGEPAPTITYAYHHIKPHTLVADQPGAAITVTDQKCIPKNVHVFASIVWTMIKPYHAILPEVTKSETLPPGCTVHRHIDTIPADVLVVANAAFKSGAKSTTWMISGTEIPKPSNMNVTTWKTPAFKIVP
jgi:hypothetical protein